MFNENYMIEAEPFRDTQVFDILLATHQIYSMVENHQNKWIQQSPAQCPSGCGTCCLDFEPDVLECEALYLAAWLLFHEKEKAYKIANEEITLRANHPTGCFLFDENSKYHCTVYGGRTSICRLFGYSGDHGKNNEIRWKPCKFLPKELLTKGFEHKQYTQPELEQNFTVLPPVMSDFMSQLISIEPSNTGFTEPLRDALPKAIKKLLMILQFREPPEPNSPVPFSPDVNAA